MVSTNQLLLICLYESVIKKKATFKSNLDEQDRRFRDRRIPRVALLKFPGSAFLYLFSCGNEQALLTLTGFDHQNFKKLLQAFSGTYNTHMFDENTGKIRKKLLVKVSQEILLTLVD